MIALDTNVLVRYLVEGDFADYVIREHAVAAGCTEVATFDAALLKEAGFRQP